MNVQLTKPIDNLSPWKVKSIVKLPGSAGVEVAFVSEDGVPVKFQTTEFDVGQRGAKSAALAKFAAAVDALKQANVDPALIYAHEKTGGLLLNPQNIRKVSQKDLDEWEAAIDEYERTTGKKVSRRLLSDEDLDGMVRYRPSSC